MKELYDEYYRVDEKSKITDKVFITRIGVSVLIIIFALFSMTFAAYGFFASDISSASNTVKTARYDLDVIGVRVETQTTKASQTAPAAETVTETAVTENNDGSFTLTPGKYVFTISRADNENMASTGYCKIMFDKNAEDVHFTNQIGEVEGSETPVNVRNVTIVVYSETTVNFIPSWGGVSYAGTPFDEETFVLTPKGQTASQSNEESGEQSNEETDNTQETTETGDSVNTIPDDTEQSIEG